MPSSARRAAVATGAGEPPVRLVDGEKVVKDEAEQSPLTRPGQSPVVFKGRRVLTLESGRQVHGCADCEFTGTRGEVVKHRVADHGVNQGGARRKTDSGPSENVTAMTLGEVLHLAGQIEDWESVVTAVTAERDDWQSRAVVAERELTKIKRALERVGFVLKVEDD